MSERYTPDYGLRLQEIEGAEYQELDENRKRFAQFSKLQVGTALLGAVMATIGVAEHLGIDESFFEHKAVAAKRITNHSELTDHIGLNNVNTIAKLDSVDSAAERDIEMQKAGVVFTAGFDNSNVHYASGSHARVTDHDIKEIFETLPDGFRSSRQQVERIEFRKETSADHHALGSTEPSNEMRVAQGSTMIDAGMYSKTTNVITAFPESVRSAEDFKSTIYHEIAHRNDWETNHLLTYEERMHLLEGVLERLSFTDRFRSDYVESIFDDDPRFETASRAKEYWAEIFAAYYVPSTVHPLPDADKKLVEFVIHLEQRAGGTK